MNFSDMKQIHLVPWAIMSGMLAFSLAACGDKAPEPAKPAPEIKPAPAAPQPKIEPPKESPPPQAAAPDMAAENAALAAKVKAALAAEPGLNAPAIDVDAKDGVVSLFGTADNTANRDKAGRVAAKVKGVKSVNNKLVIVKGS